MTPHITIRVDPDRLIASAAAIVQRVGVEVWAVVKADAYGLGIATVVPALDTTVQGWCVFTLAEAEQVRRLSAKPIRTLGPPDDQPHLYRQLRVRPAIHHLDHARALRDAQPILCVDTGMQRFACPAAEVAAILVAGNCDEAFTHATRMEHVDSLRDVIRSCAIPVACLHAAATALIDQPVAWLDAVRPGLALYRNCLRVTTPLADARDSQGPVGYTGFTTTRHGVILVGYSHGLRRGWCAIGGERRRIREVGMQTALIELGSADDVGAEVELLGDAVPLDLQAEAWNCSRQEVLLRMAGLAD